MLFFSIHYNTSCCIISIFHLLQKLVLIWPEDLSELVLREIKIIVKPVAKSQKHAPALFYSGYGTPL